MRIWPAIDILEGKCVRLSQGDYDRKTIYGINPADMASRWIADGAKCLHLVDLDGARDGSQINRKAISEIVSNFDVECQLGGGIRDEKTINDYLVMGVKRLVIGTKAIKDTEWFIKMCQKYPNRLMIALDASDGKVATDGWLEVSDRPATEFAAELAEQPIAGLIYTDIGRDGMMEGPNFNAFAQIVSAVNVNVMASGGITTVEDIEALTSLNASGCVIGKSLYEGKLTLQDAKKAAKRARKMKK